MNVSLARHIHVSSLRYTFCRKRRHPGLTQVNALVIQGRGARGIVT